MASRRTVMTVIHALALLAVAGCTNTPLIPAGTTLVIRDVTIVDTGEGRASPPQDVFIVADRIAAVRPASGDRSESPGLTVVDGRGKFLMPGLWDMHAHWWDEAYLPLFTLNGVTGIRQMRGYTIHHAWRTKGIEGTPAAPRVILGSPLVDGAPVTWQPSLEIGTPERARAVVKLIADSDADFLKVYDKVPVDAYLALMDEAHRLGVPVVGHVPSQVGWQQAAEKGVQRSFEHFTALQDSVADNSQDLARRWKVLGESLSGDAGPTPEQRRQITALDNEALDHYDPERFAVLARALAEKQVWQVPTLVLRKARFLKLDADMQQDARLKQLPAWMLDYWKSTLPPVDADSKAEAEKNRRMHAFNLARVREMHAAGVPLLAGSDVGMPYVFPGTGLHDELVLMEEAGLSPLAALQSATSNVGRFLGREDIGVIQAGALADLVLLDADPLVDIGNVRRIDGVVAGGKWMDATARQAGFATIEKIAVAPVVTADVLAAFKAQGLDAALATYARLCPASPEVRDCDGAMVAYELDGALGRSAHKHRRAELVSWAEDRFPDNIQVQEIAMDFHREAGNAAGAQKALARAMTLARGAPWLLDTQRQISTQPAAASGK